MLSTLLFFSACVTMEIESDFNEDGSATHSMALTLDMSDLEQFGGDEGLGDPFENFEQMEQEAEEQGFRVERIEDGDIVGVRLIQDVDDSSDLGAILNRLINAGAADGEEVAPFSGTFEKDGDDYRLDLTVDGRALTDTAGEGLGGEGGEGEDFGDIPFDMSMIFDFSYSARLPGEIDEDATNGRVGNDGLITWEIPLDSSATFSAASSTDDGGSNLLLILIVIGVVVLGLLALAAVAFFVLMNRRGSAPAAATPAGPAAPPPAGDPAAPATYAPPAGQTDAPPQPYQQAPPTYQAPPPAPSVDPNQPTERIVPPEDVTDEPDPDRPDIGRRDDEPRAF